MRAHVADREPAAEGVRPRGGVVRPEVQEAVTRQVFLERHIAFVDPTAIVVRYDAGKRAVADRAGEGLERDGVDAVPRELADQRRITGGVAGVARVER